MTDTVRVNLHCHSTFSDGALGVEQLAACLAQDGVRFASLTDHDTVDGLARFKAALTREAIGFVAGVEISCRSSAGGVHLLAYGSDADNPELQQVLAEARASRVAQGPAVGVGVAAGELPPSAERAIAAAHAAGGRVFLAHPLSYGPEHSDLDALVKELVDLGLDGLEGVYSPYTPDEVERLIALGARHSILISGGSDFHSDDVDRLNRLGVEMPIELWRRFRDSLFLGAGHRGSKASGPVQAAPLGSPTRLDRLGFFVRILLPTLLAIALFVIPVFAFIIPAFQDALLSRKREMIRELTNSAWSILAEYHEDEKAGRMPRAEAQRAAIDRIRFLRYGKEGKDYFWITDMHPRMVMHPYRQDLNDQDLSDFRDPNGNQVFSEFVRLVLERQEGYHEYVWQWKDDPRRMVPKQSYVKGFAPWGWVIGTGIYVEDVRAETSALTGRSIRIFGVIAFVTAVLLLFVAQQSFRIERRRRTAEEALQESHEKYRSLVEASQEGMMVVVRGRMTYANHTLLNLLGYGPGEWDLLDLDDVIVEAGTWVRPSLWVEAALQQDQGPEPIEGKLSKRNGETLDVLLSAERITLGGRPGVILATKDLSSHKGLQAALDQSFLTFRSLAQSLRAAVLRVSADRPMRVLDANPSATALFDLRSKPKPLLAVGELFVDPSDFETFQRELLSLGEAKVGLVRLRGTAGEVSASLRGVLVRDGLGEQRSCYVIAEEAMVGERESYERDALIADLQTPLLPLTASVGQFMRPLPHTAWNATVAHAAALMAQQHESAVLVTGPDGEGLGLVTDADLRQRVIGSGLPLDRPVHEIMSAPLTALSPSALNYEAMGLMREAKVGHVVVRDEIGAVLGVIGSRQFLELDRFPLAVLSSAIGKATRVEELFGYRSKLPPLVKALVDSGARPRAVCRAITSISDALTQKLLGFAEQELGPAPGPFAFIALGSQGREEQTLLTDQDNAIIYSIPDGAEEAKLRAYFGAMGERVCGWLDKAGLPLCKGAMMAQNPRWHASLKTWKEYFGAWIGVAEPQNLLDFNTFFDLRCIHGSAPIAAELRAFITHELAQTPGFFHHLAQNALHFKPPLGFFGNIVAEAAPYSSGKTFNIKDAMTPVVAFARLYALRSGVAATHTSDRLRTVRDAGAISESTHGEASAAFDILMALRLRHQTDVAARGQSLSNQINLKPLTEIEETTLKEVFSQIAVLQKKISFDFLGGT